MGDVICINNTFSILHLSDLHIVDTKNNGTYQSDLNKLIDDIVVQIKENHVINLIIVVSGDIIDKGNYENSRAAIAFFNDHKDKLYLISNLSVVDIQIVPGNHDRERTTPTGLFSQSFQTREISIKDAEEWNLYENTNKQFISFANDIEKIFNKKITTSETFGCEITEVAGNHICFLRIDTAWSEYENQSYKKLRIGKYQLDCLKEQLDTNRTELQKKGKNIDVTIAITHHPLSWLSPMDEIAIKSLFMKEDFFDVDMLLSGHVHNQSVENLYNHEHSLLTLVTGIGWSQNDPQRNKEYRYSIYSLNTFRNCCEIIVRKTNKGNSFDYDYSIYTDRRERLISKLLYPIKIMSNYPFIDVNSLNDINKTGIYVDVNIINRIREMSWIAMDLKNIFDNLLNTHCSYYISQWVDFMPKRTVKRYRNRLKNQLEIAKNDISHIIPEEIQNLMKSEITNKNFSSFLIEFCAKCVEKLAFCFSKSVKLRVHFRWLSSNDNYLKLYAKCSDDSISTNLKDLPWKSSMVEAAYNSNNSVVYSSNEWQSSISTDWDDFITIAPKFKENIIIIENDDKVKEERPAITFGISVKGEMNNKDTIVLYLLSYLKIEKLISDVLESYVNVFNVNMKRYLKYLREKKENQGENA